MFRLNHALTDIVKSEIFARIFSCVRVLKNIFCHVKNSRLWHGLPTSVKDGVIHMYCYFTRVIFHETSHMQCFAEIKLSRKFQNLQYPMD